LSEADNTFPVTVLAQRLVADSSMTTATTTLQKKFLLHIRDDFLITILFLG